MYHRRQPVFPRESSKLLAFCVFEVETCEKCMPGYTLSLGSRPMLLDENVYIYIYFHNDRNIKPQQNPNMQFGLLFDTIGQIFSFSLVNELIEV